MKVIKLISIGTFIIILSACSKNSDKKLKSIDFGKSEYYEKFLFVKSKNKPISKILVINFNDWAKQNNSYVNLQLVDEDCETNEDIKLSVNGQPSNNGIIRLNSLDSKKDGTVELELKFNSNAKSKKYNGYVIVSSSEIDRINNIDFIETGSKIFKWSAKYDIVVNPLKKGLMFFLTGIALALLIWFGVFRNIFYPKMKRGQIIINTPYYKDIRINKARMIVFTTQQQKQKLLHKIFAGKIISEVNQIWVPEIVITSGRKNMLRIRLGLGYTIIPFGTNLRQGASYEIKKNSEIFRISFL